MQIQRSLHGSGARWASDGHVVEDHRGDHFLLAENGTADIQNAYRCENLAVHLGAHLAAIGGAERGHEKEIAVDDRAEFLRASAEWLIGGLRVATEVEDDPEQRACF